MRNPVLLEVTPVGALSARNGSPRSTRVWLPPHKSINVDLMATANAPRLHFAPGDFERSMWPAPRPSRRACGLMQSPEDLFRALCFRPQEAFSHHYPFRSLTPAAAGHA